MRVVIRVVVAVMALAGGSTGQNMQMPPSAPTAPEHSANWCEFLWEAADVGDLHFAKAALLVPVRVPEDKHTYYMQVDTGAITMFYDVPYLELIRKHGSSDNKTSFTGTIANHDVVNYPVRLVEKFGHALGGRGPEVIGTLGMEFFAHHNLTIDFPKQRLLILDWQALPDHYVERRMTFVEGIYRDDRYYVALTLAGKQYKDDFFFDTASSSQALITDEARWRALTGRNGDEPNNLQIVGNRWGEKVRWVAAPLRGSMEVGGVKLDNPLVFYTPNRQVELHLFDGRIAGLFGNAPFFDRTIIVDPYRKRFGVSD
ncbi:MAG TPA: hypothetical protein VD837_13345 [Terriglobales bacterium]|nr:hypothetical protein [Terriglobales bacterium]